MRSKHWIVGVGVLSVALLAGCKEKESGVAPGQAETKQGDVAVAANAMVATAQAKLDEAVKYIKDNKLDLADKALKQVEEMKASLPAAWQPKIDEVRKLLEAAKAGQLKVPSLPKL